MQYRCGTSDQPVLLGVGGVFVGVVDALTDSVAAVALLAVTGSTLVRGLTSAVDCASCGVVSSDPPLLVAWIAVAGWVGGVSVCVVGALIDSVAAVAPVAVTGSTLVTGLTSAVDGASCGAVLSDPPLLVAWILVAGRVGGVWVLLGVDAVVVLLLGSSVAPLGVAAVPGLGVAELLMWLGVAVVAEVVSAGGVVPEVPEGLEVFVLLLVGELGLPVSAWTTAGVAAVSAIPTPKAAASPPIRPTKWAYSVMPILPRRRQGVVVASSQTSGCDRMGRNYLCSDQRISGSASASRDGSSLEVAPPPPPC
jgi:hypothetical protein